MSAPSFSPYQSWIADAERPSDKFPDPIGINQHLPIGPHPTVSPERWSLKQYPQA
jgi:hypothetical protein